MKLLSKIKNLFSFKKKFKYDKLNNSESIDFNDSYDIICLNEKDIKLIYNIENDIICSHKKNIIKPVILDYINE
tara:strand:+ start:1452 stop:1673 length:222 start_codon:yes stop_codon:yes gene_type:complete